MNNVSFKTNNFLLVNQRDEKVEIDDPKKSSGFFDLFISEDLEFQSLIQHGFINESGNICTENLEPFDLPIINEETKKKLYLFLKSKKIKIESTFGVNLPFRVTLEEIFNTLESTSFELVGSGIWFFLGYDYLKLCCKQIQHKDGKILWDCLEPAQKKKLEEKLRKRPSDFDFRIFNDDLNISNKIRDLFIQKCLINKLSPKHICTLLNEYIPDWKTRFKLPNEVKQPKEFYQTLLEIFIYTFAFNKWWVQKDKNAANQSSIFGFTDGNTGFDFLILKKSKDENLTKRYISPKDSIVLSLTFLKQDLNNLEYRDLNLIDSRKLNFLEPSQYYNIDLSSQFESQEFSSNVNNTFSNFLSVGVNSLYNDSRQSLIEVMGNFSTGFEGEPLAREWAVYLKKMTQGQVLNTKGVFKRFFEKECECLKNQNTKKKETLPDL